MMILIILLKNIEKTSFKNKNKFGQNVLIGKMLKLDQIVQLVIIQLLKKMLLLVIIVQLDQMLLLEIQLIKNNVSILDNCVIGKNGFGFFPIKNKNIRYPHIGIVLIEDNCEIGCGSTIDRGSLSNTIIGKNTYLDNQIHIAHNVKIGENCIIAGQVGFAGSSIIGNNVMIGGQAGYQDI